MPVHVRVTLGFSDTLQKRWQVADQFVLLFLTELPQGIVGQPVAQCVQVQVRVAKIMQKCAKAQREGQLLRECRAVDVELIRERDGVLNHFDEPSLQ